MKKNIQARNLVLPFALAIACRGGTMAEVARVAANRVLAAQLARLKLAVESGSPDKHP